MNFEQSAGAQLGHGTTLADGRYKLEELLGKGGMAEVHRAFDTDIGVRRAIKVLNPALAANEQVRSRFENEAYAMAKIGHANIVNVHDVVEDGPRIFIVMELVDGGSLHEMVKRRGPRAPREAVELVIPLLDALRVAHDAGIIHRDIKPDNVLLDRKGVAKLADFGIARVLDRTPNLTRTGAVMGTWAYMSPEQRESAKGVDGRSDIYAMGAMVYYLVAGREPFDLHNPEAHERAYEGFPDELSAVITRATRYKPDDRFGDAEQMKAALEEIATSLPAVAIGTATPSRTFDLDAGAASVDSLSDLPAPPRRNAAGLPPGVSSLVPDIGSGQQLQHVDPLPPPPAGPRWTTVLLVVAVVVGSVASLLAIIWPVG